MSGEVTVTAPFRLSVAGGGSDLPTVYVVTGGELLAVALQDRVTVNLSRRADGRIRRAQGRGPWTDPEEVRPRECLASAAVATLQPAGADIRVEAPISPGAGLGGSGAFCVAVTAGLMALSGRRVTRAHVFETALHIERDVYRAAVGAQDVAVASFGGFVRIKVDRGGAVQTEPAPRLGCAFQDQIAPSLILVDTGLRRSARQVLNHTGSLTDPETVGKRLIEQVRTFERIISSGDVAAYGRELSTHWEEKRLRSPGMTCPKIDGVYRLGVAAGCAGGKLVGAGGGGYFLFAGRPEALARLCEAAGRRSLETRPILPDVDGGLTLRTNGFLDGAEGW